MARWWLRGLAAASCLPCTGCFLAMVVCVFAVVTVAAALCATHSREEDESRYSSGGGGGGVGCFGNLKLAPKARGRALLNTLSSKRLLLSKKWGRSEEEEVEAYDRTATAMEDGNLLWQKSILMGERCQPLNFSGLIIYDHKGNRLPQFPPRSPKRNWIHPSVQEANFELLSFESRVYSTEHHGATSYSGAVFLVFAVPGDWWIAEDAEDPSFETTCLVTGMGIEISVAGI